MEQKKKMISIKTKLLAIMLPVITVSVLLLVLISYNISKNIIMEYAQKLLVSSVENQASAIESWLQENLSAFNIVKQTIEGTNPDDVELQAMLEQYYDFDADYPNGLYVADAKGTCLHASSFEMTAGNIKDAVWYQDAHTRVNVGFTNAYENEAGQAMISACGMLKENKKDVRVISADLSLQRISLIVNTLVEMEQAQAFLVNTEDGSILAHRDTHMISQKLSDIDDAFLQGVAEKMKTWDYSLTEISGNMTAFVEITGTDWLLVSYIPSSVIFKQVNNFRNIIIIIGTISILLLAVLIERMVHITMKPVKELTNIIRIMTAGDFTVAVNTRSHDEIGVMGRCVETFVTSMRSMISSIHDVSGRLQKQAECSDEVSGQMYDATKQQSESMKELNVTVEQLSRSVSEIAENATTLAMVVADTRVDGDKVDDKVRETVDISRQGKTDMQNVSKAMQDINDSVKKLQSAIDKVGKSSEEITNITNVIGNIAEETNLLSLNASIEAARAGEAGRGFAVVATEIGNLAKTSAQSVQNIERLISEINLLIKDAVDQAEDSVENISSSSTLVGNALLTFDTIFTNIDSVNNLVQQMIEKVDKVDTVAENVAAISEVQAASAEEILASSDLMVEHANLITGNSEIMANEAKELTASAQKLSEQVEIFKIES